MTVHFHVCDWRNRDTLFSWNLLFIFSAQLNIRKKWAGTWMTMRISMINKTHIPLKEAFRNYTSRYRSGVLSVFYEFWSRIILTAGFSGDLRSAAAQSHTSSVADIAGTGFTSRGRCQERNQHLSAVRSQLFPSRTCRLVQTLYLYPHSR